MRRRGRRTRPSRAVVITISVALALVGGLIVGITANQLGQPVNLSAGDGENCDPSAPAEQGAQPARAQGVRWNNSTRTRDRGGWRNGRQSPDPSAPAEPGAPEPSESAPQPSESAPEPSESAPSESAPPCDDGQGGDQGGDGQAGGGEGEEGGDDGQQAQPIGPFEDDFVNIRQVQPNVQAPRPRRGASRGTFTSNCGVSDHQSNANLVLAPGQENGAHHLHDMVGNKEADGFSTNDSLAASGSTCTNGDQTMYEWPVIRVRGEGDDPNAAAVEDQNNIGTPALPTRARLQWRGNPTARVVAAPRFIRLITGDAKTITNGLGNARPSWTCTGFTNRITDKYPLCPEGSQVLRIMDLPSCWDGQNTDSANHRDHVRFPDAATGQCPAGTRPIPQLRMTLAFDLPNEPVAFALDGFATERHTPSSDHAAAINVMSERLMQRAVRCINSGRRC